MTGFSFFRALLLAALPVVSFAAGTANLIPNPGFENGEEGWHRSDYGHLGAVFAVDTGNPHSGKASWHLALDENAPSPGEANAFCGPLPVQGGMAFRLCFWMRGRSNAGPLQIQLRQEHAPYATYWAAECAPSPEWSETVMTVVLPPQVDPKTILVLNVRPGNSVWLDDFELTTLPAAEEGAPLSGNQVRNGSFEVGTEGWFATFQERKDPLGGDGALAAVSGSGIRAPWGARALRVAPPPGCMTLLTSSYFPLRYGHPATVSFWAKGTPGRDITVYLGSGKDPNVTRLTHDVVLGDGWTFCSFPVTPGPSASGRYFLEFAYEDAEPFLLDGVAAVEGGQPLRDAPPLHGVLVGVSPAPGIDPARLFSRGDDARFLLSVLSAAPRILDVRTVDPWGRTVGRFPLPVKQAAETPQTVPVSLPTGEYGGFKGIVFDGKTVVAEIPYAVLPPVIPLKEAGDSFFGGNARLTPYNLHIMERAGFRWLRLYGPILTLWMSVEPQPGAWKFETAAVRRARDQGFHILGVLATAPAWRTADPKRAAGSTWWTSWPPADPAAWRDYIARTQRAYAGLIDHWEVWNEPETNFLQVPPGQDRTDLYLELLTSADAASPAGQILLGGVPSSFPSTFADAILRKGAAGHMDAFSFHDYDASAGRSPDEAGFLPALQAIAALPGRRGTPLETWVTEEGVYLDDGASWLDLAGIPSSSRMTPGEAAGAIVRTAAWFKAAGVKRHFVYQATTQPTGQTSYRNACCGLLDVNGLPLPALAAHAAMVHFLDDAEAAGVETVAAGAGRVTLAHFRKNGRRLDVAWSRDGAALGDVPGWNGAAGIRAFDLMANPIPADRRTRLTLTPLYLLR